LFRLLRGILCVALVELALVGTPATAAEVALTFDDLPLVAGPASFGDYAAITARLLAGLKRHHLPATGFVIGNQIEGPGREQRRALLGDWLDGGMELGNHSYSHLSLSQVPVDDYIADVARDDAVLRPLLAEHGKTPLWYRHPFLETGSTAAARDVFEHWLAEHGYRVAPVTMENSDWLFALPYDEAVRKGDADLALRIRRAYLDYSGRIIPWYRDASKAVLGREIAFVLLLHASRLNADSIDDLAGILKANHLHGVSLKRAVRDPAYRIPDDYAGPNGIEWLERWSRTLHKNMPWSTLPPAPTVPTASTPGQS
jgi:peptidoglycan/xylan/chitin deacetylase (PgdA/CDA1 family)